MSMTIANYISCVLRDCGVTDAFGIPGGVILELIYALEATDGIIPHLSYHEQCAGFAACGYAQASGRLGVAYATRGPGFTNLITAIADAYYDSIPVLFITAHAINQLPNKERAIADQEMDSCSIVKNITKFARRVDKLEDVAESLNKAIKKAISGRKGPVFLDFDVKLFKQNIEQIPKSYNVSDPKLTTDYTDMIVSAINKAEHPVILVGDGINQAGANWELNQFLTKAEIPVISSRYSHNVVDNATRYYGYVGSHGIRYANFILSKADFILVLGNRLHFPSSSPSYEPIVKNAIVMQFDIDENEIKRHDLVDFRYKADVKGLLEKLSSQYIHYKKHDEWLVVCSRLRDELWEEDVNDVVRNISDIIRRLPSCCTIVSDVGNNEFWTSRACVFSAASNRTLYSKSFGTLGSALGKAIGAYYSTKKPILVFIGDQGLQINIQELQYISQHCLPITIVLLDNASSGMIKDREQATGHNHYLHTTIDSEYSIPNFQLIAKSYGITAYMFSEFIAEDIISSQSDLSQPKFIEMKIHSDIPLTPSLPKGRVCQDMDPRLNKKKYEYLNLL